MFLSKEGLINVYALEPNTHENSISNLRSMIIIIIFP